MIPRELVPTLLVSPAERPPLAAAERPTAPSRWRAIYVLRHLSITIATVMWTWARGRLTATEYGRIVRGFLERMGAVWIKAGQILSLRTDIFPVAFCQQLADLRDLAVAVPFDVVRGVAEGDLGGPLEQYFDEFTQTPFAATTVAQLHRARLRLEGVWVAVKIQQPYATELFRRDFALIRRMTAVLSRVGIHRHLGWSGMSQELHDTMTRELNFAYEASSLRTLRKTLRGHGVYVPTVFTRYSRARVLVMEYIHAALMADFIELRRRDPDRLARWLDENNIKPRRVAARLFHSVLRQVLEDNLFHGDLNPYNLILLRNSRLAVIDCRSAASLEVENLAKHRMFLRAIANGEYAIAADIHFLFSSRLPLVDLARVKDELVRTWRVWESRTFIRPLPYAEKSLTAMFDEINRVVINHRFAVQWSMTRFARAFANLDASLVQLHPQLNVLTRLQRYFKRAGNRARAARQRSMPQRVDRALVAAAQLPRMLLETSILQQTIVRRQAQVIEGSTTKAGALLAGLFRYAAFILIVIDTLLVCAFLDQQSNVTVARIVGPQLATLVAAAPRLDTWAWLLVVGVVFVMSRSIQTLAGRFARKTVRVPEVPPAV